MSSSILERLREGQLIDVTETPAFIVRAVLILAPFPPGERGPPGHMIRALINAEVRLATRWPFVAWNVYCAERWSGT